MGCQQRQFPTISMFRHSRQLGVCAHGLVEGPRWRRGWVLEDMMEAVDLEILSGRCGAFSWILKKKDRLLAVAVVVIELVELVDLVCMVDTGVVVATADRCREW